MIYSRRLNIEERRNKRKAYFFIILTLISITLIILYGLPAVVKFAAFLTDLKQTQELPEQEDKTPPPPPYFDAIPETTNQSSIDVSGTTEPGATVILFINDKKDEILANSEGRFTYKFNLKKDENTISAFAKDSSGNESQKTQIFKIIYDTEPPSLEILKPKDGSEFFGPHQRQVIVEGKTEEGAQIQINGRLVVVDVNGTFSLATTLQDGSNIFSVKAQDRAGNITEKTLLVKYSP